MLRTRRFMNALLVAAAVALPAAACSDASTGAGGSPTVGASAPSASVASPTAGAAPALSEPAREAVRQLEEAGRAMSVVGRYAFTLHLVQKLSGGSAAESVFEVTNAGKVERSPLKLDQTIDSVQDGDKSTLRAILVPDAYYVYDPSFEEWGKLPKEQAADIARTLSEYQTDPALALASAAALGSGLASASEGGRVVVSYEGAGPEALAFLKHILEGTLDLGSLDAEVQDSIRLRSLTASFTLDAASHLPLAYRVASDMTIEYERGSPSVLSQVFEGTYGKHDATEAIAVPKAALEAPELDPPIDDPAASEGDIGSLDDLEGLDGLESN